MQGLSFACFKKSFRESYRKAFFIFLITLCAAFAARAQEHDYEPVRGWDTPPAKKADIFEWDLHKIHDIDGMILSDIRVFTDENGDTYTEAAYSDSAYWTGNYMLGECMKFAATGDDEARRYCENSARALIRMTRITGVPGLPVRGYMDPKYSDRFRLTEEGSIQRATDGVYLNLDVSIDQLLGAMQGLHMAYRFLDDEELKRDIAAAVSDVLDYIIDNDYQIIDLDGEPTTWGVFTPGKIPSNLHAFLLLTVLRVGAWITGEQRHLDAYEYLRVEKAYGTMSRTAKFTAVQSYSDDAMEFMGYLNMLMVEDDPAAREDYLASMRRSWKTVKRHNKAFFNLIMLHTFKDLPGWQGVMARTLEQLRHFPTEKKHYAADFCGYPRDDLSNPNPIQFRPVMGFHWTANPYQCSIEETPGMQKISSGVDFLAAYWLARYWDMIYE